MKPAPFRYYAPTSIAEALELMRLHAPDSRPLAGGQSLLPMMNFRLARPTVLVDLNRVADLAYIRDAGDQLAIGAMTRERAIETSDLVARLAPLLHQATGHIAHLPIRSRGTIGGSIANADPAAEYPATVLALAAELVLRSTRGERRMAAADFFRGVLTTAIEPDELLVEIRVPKAPARAGSAFVEISRRHGDFALVGIAAEVTLDGGGRIATTRLGACGVGAKPARLVAAEKALAGATPDARAFEAAGAAAAAEIEPSSDLHAVADYRRRLASVLTRRALANAVDAARRAA